MGQPSSGPATLATLQDVIASVVWLVDDSALQGEISRRILAGTHTVVLFDSAGPMLERLSAGERPDLLVLDWHMPEISGLEACRVVRSVADAAELPIVFLTATGNHDDLLQGFSAGASDFLHKPVDTGEMNARISGLVRMKRLHARLVATESALREEASFRERFLAILAHDLRQPLGIFTLGSEMLAAPDTPQDTRERLKAVFTKATGRMQRMIGELLDFSRTRPEGGGMRVLLQPADLAVVVRDLVEQIRIEHPERTITLDLCQVAPGNWDGDRLSQVVGNLLENALSNSAPHSPVRVALTAVPGGFDITVENSGEPLAPELVATLFDPFQRGGAHDRRDRGLGLGLYIVDQIVRAHGGTVTVHGADERIRFSVILPVATTVAVTPGAKLPPLILVVDDNQDALALCVAALGRAGFRVEQACDGLEALEKIAKARPDLVLMDLAMPRMDGCEATRLIKADPLTRGIVVVVVTGVSMPAALDRARAAGAAQVSPRPCSSGEMVALIQKHLDKAA